MKSVFRIQDIQYLFLSMFLFASPTMWASNLKLEKQNTDSIQVIQQLSVQKSFLLSLSPVVSVFFPTKDAKDLGYNFASLYPGGELKLTCFLKNIWSVSSGINYQFGRIKNYQIGGYNERITFSELVFPLNTTFYFIKSRRNLNLTSGLYLGKYLSSKLETSGGKMNPNDDWHEIKSDFISGYTTNKKIADFYFSVGFDPSANKTRKVRFNIFTKYRLIDNWLYQDVSRFVFGIKFDINFALN